MFSSKDLFFTPAAGGFTVSKSLRFRSSASAYLSKATFATPTDNKKWTWSAWVKIGTINPWAGLFYGGGIGTSQPLTELYLYTDGNLYYQTYNGSVNTGLLQTTQVFRDPSAWYHIVLVIDIANATANNRQRIYVNGAEVTAFSSRTNHGTSDATYFNNASYAGYIGESFPVSGTAAKYFDGYMAEVNFIDGAAKTPSDFGAYDTNGIWQPAAYTGSYGTNGFYLKFTDVGATSGSNTGYGKDFAGTNYWTTNNFGTTSTNVDYDSMLDSPTNATGNIGNYAVLNPIDQSTATITEANLKFQGASGAAYSTTRATIALPSSDKWYWENTISTVNTATSQNGIVGLCLSTVSLTAGFNTAGYFTYENRGDAASGFFNDGATIYSGNTVSWTTNDVIQIAVDMSTGKVWFGKNNSWWDSSAGTTGNPAAGTNATITISGANLAKTIVPMLQNYGTSGITTINFGQRPFAYTPPSGFSALNTQNLSTPTINNGAAYMAAVTYTGTGSSQTITTSSTNSGNNPNGTTFQPDFVWVKGRSGATDHALYDAVRGVQLQLESNTTGAETTETTGLTAFTSSGFTTGALAQMNTNTATYVAWEWNAGGSNATNTTGTIQSTVRANTTAGFSVATFTTPSTFTNATVGHGLGVAPSMIIVKSTTNTGDWITWHTSLGINGYLTLNTTSNSGSNSGSFNGTSSTTWTMGSNTWWQASARTWVAYCFAPVSGYSAFGSYTGNGSTDGPFIYTGFRPRWIMFKASSTTGSWNIQDTSRDTYNLAIAGLYADLSQAEDTSRTTDILSNGFKFRGTAGNASGTTYIYAAFAENPFKISRAR